ncbi:hypothetical protein ML462_09330 [Gramella lutea]|uniref:Uncharacterized protein n=1 Tax=Christiangramia lutea TaxID=1607951 RepID=A0A9X2AAP0_9FLAO|nr:hypothetical protein [Christiangramia lutea]MCH4823376.1 hypothetical protein [Christiangramia lutea]
MRKLEITLTEEQHQHIVAERNYGNRTNLEEGTFGGYELCLHVASPDVILATLELKIVNSIDLGKVECKIQLSKYVTINFEERDRNRIILRYRAEVYHCRHSSDTHSGL